MSRALRVGLSPCPNDVFAFAGLLAGAVRARGLAIDFAIADVEELNGRFERGELDASKASFAAALGWGDRALVLPVGAALGFGVGPLLLASREGVLHGARIPAEARVLCPGERTTAHLLYRQFHAGEGRVEQVRFSEILPALERGEADYGVCIHEARFTWRGRGLAQVEDLGATWEARARCPLPLGGILARRDLGEDALSRLSAALRDSLAWARDHRDEALARMRSHAQEMSEEVLWAHVDLYVNGWTLDLGDEGARAIDRLAALAIEAGLLPAASTPLRVFGAPDA